MGPTFVGVKELSGSSSLLKRDFLLFDQIAVPFLNAGMALSNDPAARADLDWLVDEQFLVDFSIADFTLYLQTKGNTSSHSLLFAGPFLVQAAMFLTKLAGREETQNLRMARAGAKAFMEQLLTATASYLTEARGVRASAIMYGSEFSLFEDLHHHAKEIVAFLGELPTEIRDAAILPNELFAFFSPGMGTLMTQLVDEIGAVVETGAITTFEPIRPISMAEDLLNSYLEHHTSTDVPMASVLEIVTDILPVPDETVPWEQIRDFRRDETTRLHCLRLREWMRTIAKDSLSPAEVREQLEILLHEYRAHIKLHNLKTQPGVIQTLVSVPAEIALTLRGSALPMLRKVSLS